MSNGIGFRQIARQAVYGYLGRFKVGHEQRLRGVHRARPASFPALPAAYVGDLTDTLAFPGAARWRDLAIEVVLVGDQNDNELAADALDALADDLIYELSRDRHFLYDGVHLQAGDTIAEPRQAVGGELEIGGVRYPAVIVTLLGHLEEPIQ